MIYLRLSVTADISSSVRRPLLREGAVAGLTVRHFRNWQIVLQKYFASFIAQY